MDHDEWLAERFEEHRSHLRAVAYRILGSLSETEDAVQETFLRAYRAYPRLDSEEGLRPWLFKIAANLCRNRARDRARCRG